ncbi:MAG: hydrogenase nickel incorporation protein HypB [Planctomycetota bacterium]
MTEKRIPIVEKILNANDRLADRNRGLLDASRTLGLNVMASPGAGKTSLILRTLERLRGRLRLAVIEGDTAPVTLDSEKVLAAGVPAVQVNTGGGCHLDAAMVGDALAQLDLEKTDLVIVENVGNLVCPAAFRLGTHRNVLVASVTEGDDKPYKYPKMYRNVDALVLNKIDLLPHVDFDAERFQKGVAILNEGLAVFPLSCRTGEGLDAWIDWALAAYSAISARRI